MIFPVISLIFAAVFKPTGQSEKELLSVNKCPPRGMISTVFSDQQVDPSITKRFTSCVN